MRPQGNMMELDSGEARVLLAYSTSCGDVNERRAKTYSTRLNGDPVDTKAPS